MQCFSKMGPILSDKLSASEGAIRLRKMRRAERRRILGRYVLKAGDVSKEMRLGAEEGFGSLGTYE